jgi:choline dehydrogenase-like flavoprotein
MIIDGRSIRRDAVVRADVCIVGAGAAGITLARDLAGQPFKVVILESGGLQPDGATQALYRGGNVGLPYHPLEAARLRYFGGTTNHWEGECRPLEDIDFEARPGIPHSGWPFPRSTLLPFYQRAHVVCQLGPPSYDVERWETAAEPRLPTDETRVVTRILQHSPPTRFGPVYLDALRAVRNVDVHLHANVVELETTSNARTVTRARVRILEGDGYVVASRLFILAAGGIENARLLLLSRRVHEGGLGNGHDLVGRFFMEHHEVAAGRFLPTDAALRAELYRPPHVIATRPNVRVRGVLTLADDVLRREQLLNFQCEMELAEAEAPASSSVESLRRLLRALRTREAREDLVQHLWSVVTDLAGAATGAGRRSRAPLFELRHVSEQAPNPQSRVTLSDERDALGLNRCQLDWRLTALDRRSVIRGEELIGVELARAGLGRVRLSVADDGRPWEILGQSHHMGTTRMHADPKQGVVDDQCRVHGVSNLFIAGSSVFPTSGSGHPTFTIVALALRLAGHVKRLMGARA